MKKDGLNRFVLDLTQVLDIDMRVIQLMITIIKKCKDVEIILKSKNADLLAR